MSNVLEKGSSSVILNVNDDPAARYIVTRMLKHSGFDVLEAATGGEALRFARDETPALIILDVNLPDINGLEVCRILKTDPATASLPVLHLSAARIRSEDRALGLDGGADGYLTQPVDGQVLVATVNALLRLSRAEGRARAAAQSWEAVFGAISDGVCLVDAEGNVQRCNEAMAILAGRTVPQLEGQFYGNILATAFPGAAFPPEAAAAPVMHRMVVEIPTADPQRRWLRLTLEPLAPPARAGSAASAAEAGASVRVVTDITHSKEATLRQRLFLRDILASVTEGKLHLCVKESDLPAPLDTSGQKIPLSPSSVRMLRNDVRQAAAALEFPSERLQDLETAVGEAAMNAVVHAGKGTGQICSDGTRTVQVWIEDSGGGIDIDRLHRATLERGYTTAGTLGHGFWIILKTCDRIHLLTGEVGTTIVLEQEKTAPVPAWVRQLPGREAPLPE